MNQEYYIIVDGLQVGPLSKEELIRRNISGETLIWRYGLKDWVKANELPEIEQLMTYQSAGQSINPEEEPRWFAMINGMQKGPYTVTELIANGLTPETPVWRSGMADWADASTQPEIMQHFSATPPPFGNDFANNPQYNTGSSFRFQEARQTNFNNFSRQQQNPYANTNPNLRTNWLPWAIIATITGLIFSCVGAIFGIIGIINANKANNLYAGGFDQMGDQANGIARTMTIIGLILAGIGLIVTGISFNYFPLSRFL